MEGSRRYFEVGLENSKSQGDETGNNGRVSGNLEA